MGIWWEGTIGEGGKEGWREGGVVRKGRKEKGRKEGRKEGEIKEGEEEKRKSIHSSTVMLCLEY